MKRCLATLSALPGSPYSQSGKHEIPKLPRESEDAYDERTWREHCSVDPSGQVVIPIMALKQATDTAAFKLGMKVKGRGVATYKNFFKSGIIVERSMPLFDGKKPIMKADAEMAKVSSSSTGTRGGGKRVDRRFPLFPVWSGQASFLIADPIITQDVFEPHLKAAGQLVGLGRWRTENGGMNGRFLVEKFQWEEFEL